MNSNLTRRDVLRHGGLLLTFSTATGAMLLSPAQAREKGVEFRTLEKDEVETLEAFGNILHQDAASSGLAHFIDHQLAADPNECLLMAKYFNVTTPYAGFYRAGLTALNALARARHEARFAELSGENATALVREISGTVPEGWDGPPAPLFYIIVRADVVDVVYGTVKGFERLGVPYMPHILPEQPW